MIARLRGTLVERGLQQVIVDVGGVGYLAHVSLQTLTALPPEGHEVELRCHTHVREDALQVFGFVNADEQRAFELLITVSGIGPKLALTILSGMSVSDLLGSIAGGDHRRLQSIPGVGKKTAERMVVDLKDRCAELQVPGVAAAAAITGGGAGGEVVAAMANLGYKKNLAERAVERVLKREADRGPLGAEQLLRAALAVVQEL
jgi:Holliday junction DNA helicase RuvA